MIRRQMPAVGSSEELTSLLPHVLSSLFRELVDGPPGGDADAFADATYAESWSHQEVTDQKWTDLRAAFEREVRTWAAQLATPRDWDVMTLSGFASSVAHTAYHLVPLRQLVPAAAGPPAKD